MPRVLVNSSTRYTGHEGSLKALFRLGIGTYAFGLALVLIAGLAIFPRLAGAIFFSWDSATYVANAKFQSCDLYLRFDHDPRPDFVRSRQIAD